MAKTNTARNNVLNYYFRGATLPAFTGFLGLLLAPANASGGGTEVSGGGYARVAVAGKFSVAADGAIVNSTPIAFPTPTGVWAPSSDFADQVALFDALENGVMHRYINLATPKAIGIGDAPTFAAGSLIFREG